MCFSSAAFARVNVTLNPLGVLAGAFRGAVEFEAGSNWSVGPVLGGAAIKLNDVSLSSMELGVRANYFSSGTFNDSWYIGPEVAFSSFRASSDGVTANISAVSGSLFGGYFWIWDSFNMNLGGGARLRQYPRSFGGRTVRIPPRYYSNP